MIYSRRSFVKRIRSDLFMQEELRIVDKREGEVFLIPAHVAAVYVLNPARYEVYRTGDSLATLNFYN